MGYYLNVLQEGAIYDLDGQKLKFIQKIDGAYYFHVCKYDEWSLNYIPTDLVASYDIKEINYIKRFQSCSPKGALKRIGKDKVFSKY